MRKKFCDRARGLLGDVDLALLQPLQQVVGRQVDQHDLVGVVEHAVGHRLAHLDAGDAADDVVQALEVLDVDRRVDVDARVEQLVHVLPALGVARAGRVGVRELVDEQQRGLARERGVEVELLERAAAVLDALARQDLEAVEQRGGLGAAVRLDDADDDIAALRAQALRLGQHRVGLADAGRRAEEDLEPAALARARSSSMRASSASGSGRSSSRPSVIRVAPSVAGLHRSAPVVSQRAVRAAQHASIDAVSPRQVRAR